MLKTRKDYNCHTGYFYDVEAVTTDKITVTKHDLHVKVDDIYTTYGENISQYASGYGYTYTESDFQYDDADDVENISDIKA